MKNALMLLLAALLCGGITACSDPDKSAFKDAKQKWEAVAPAHYSFMASIFCECIMGQYNWVEVEVRQGEAVAYRDPDTGRDLMLEGDSVMVIAEYPGAWPAVDEYFDRIEKAWELKDKVTAEYDDSLGYPLSTSITGDPEIPDDQISYRLRDLKILP